MSSPAILIKFTNPKLQRYLQHYPFASGPDEAINRHCLNELATVIQIRPVEACSSPPREGEVMIPPVWKERCSQLYKRLNRKQQEIPGLFADYGWRINRIPPSAQRILSIGCAGGSELVVIRSAFPDAIIEAMDWECTISPADQSVLGVRVEINNFIEPLASESRQYDAIFSNHVIEHLYNPDDTLGSLRQWLVPGGVLVSALPMDGDPDCPFVDSMLKLVARTESLSPLDLDCIDLGHPWKTNLSDLYHTLVQAGFEGVEFYQRFDHISRPRSGTRKSHRLYLTRGKRWHAIFLSPLRTLLRLVPGSPRWIRRLLFAVECRVWFGHNSLKNSLAPEVLFVARNPKENMGSDAK